MTQMGLSDRTEGMTLNIFQEIHRNSFALPELHCSMLGTAGNLLTVNRGHLIWKLFTVMYQGNKGRLQPPAIPQNCNNLLEDSSAKT